MCLLVQFIWADVFESLIFMLACLFCLFFSFLCGVCLLACLLVCVWLWGVFACLLVSGCVWLCTCVGSSSSATATATATSSVRSVPFIARLFGSFTNPCDICEVCLLACFFCVWLSTCLR